MTRRVFLKLLTLLPFLRPPRFVTETVTKEEKGQLWAFPLAFPICFPPAEELRHKQYLPLVIHGNISD